MEQQITARTETGLRGGAWLHARLFPSGVGALMFAAYAMNIVSLVTFALFQRDVPQPQYYLGLVGLSAMFVLQVVAVDLETRFGEQRGGLLHLSLSGLLWLLVSWIAIGSNHFIFIPYLMFMLVAQAVVSLRPRGGMLYSVVLVGSWLGVLLVAGFSVGAVLANAMTLSTGLIFVFTFGYVIGLYRDQTVRAEALLARLTAANAELELARQREKELAAAEERVRIARDIHDGLGHHLTALNVQLQAAARLIERDPARAAAAISTSREVAQAALDEVRQSVAALRRTPLDGKSLSEALTALVNDFGRRAELAASLQVTGPAAALLPAAAQTLYRAAQEGLTNAQRHASARSVVVVLAYGAAATTLTVTDDGAGVVGPGGMGFGLAGLRERAEQLGGSFHAGPLPAGGFQLTLAVPALSSEATPT